MAHKLGKVRLAQPPNPTFQQNKAKGTVPTPYPPASPNLAAARKLTPTANPSHDKKIRGTGSNGQVPHKSSSLNKEETDHPHLHGENIVILSENNKKLDALETTRGRQSPAFIRAVISGLAGGRPR